MGRPKTPKPNETAFDRALLATLSAEPTPPMIVPAARDNRKQVIRHKQTSIENVRDTIIRIQQQADPIGFLINVQNGALFEVVHLDEDGLQHISYVTPNLKQRMETARFLASKILPTLSLQKIIVDDKDPAEQEQNFQLGAEGAPSFAQLVAAAASQVSNAGQPPKPKVTVTEPLPIHDGTPVYPGSAGEGLEDADD